MTNLWNIKDLSPPATNTYIAPSRKLDITDLRKNLSEAIRLFGNQHQLHKEAALLSRFTYKLKLRLRCDKGFQGMEMTNRALRKYLHINLLKILTDFNNGIPRQYESETYLPSRQMLVFILVRLQGFCKLLCRIVNTSQIAADFLHKRVEIGHLWHVGFIGFGMMSRINVICREFAKDICKIYEGLLAFAPYLEEVGAAWLVDYKDLPTDLHKWIDVDWIYKDVTTPIVKNEPISKIFNLCESDDDIENTEFENTEKLSVDEFLNDEKTEFITKDVDLVDETDERKLNDLNQRVNLLEDFGEVVGNKCSTSKLSKSQKRKLKKKVVATSKNAESLKTTQIQNQLSELEMETNITKENNKRKKKTQITQVNSKRSKSEENKVNECINKSESSDETILNSERTSSTNIGVKNVIDNINTVEELQLFIKKERKLRDKLLKKSMSKHLDKLQWSMLERVVLSFTKKCTNPTKTNKYLRKSKDALIIGLIV